MRRRPVLLSLWLLALATAGRAAPAPQSAPMPPSLSQSGRRLYLGALSRGTLSTQPVELSLADALSRGLQYNVGLLVAGTISEEARAARLEQLSALLPRAEVSLRESRQKTNLQALGIGFPGVPPTVQVSNFDARLSVSVPLLDLHALSNARAAEASARAAEWDARDARETVTLAIASAYLQVVTSEAAVAAAKADLETATALYRLASDREQSGLAPNIDTLRAKVEMQGRQQALTQAANTLDKQRIGLLRIVGLPLRQSIVLTTRAAYRQAPAWTAEDLVARATAARADYKSAEANVRAAELSRRAALLERAPTVSLDADGGALGTQPSNALWTWSAAGVVRVPILQGGRIRADAVRADAVVRQRRAELDDLRIAIEQDVNDALLDVRSTAERVDVSASTVDVATLALTQARDRFSAGIANNIEVIQAQEALVDARQQYIAALHDHNLAKLTLARAMGSVEQTWKELLAP